MGCVREQSEGEVLQADLGRTTAAPQRAHAAAPLRRRAVQSPRAGVVPMRRRLFRLPWRSAPQICDDVDEELRFHIDMRASELVARGMDPQLAQQEARHQFGDLEYTRVYCRNLDAQQERVSRLFETLHDVAQDIRYAVRT